MGKKEGTHIQYSDKPWHLEDLGQPPALCKLGGWRATRREREPGLRSKGQPWHLLHDLSLVTFLWAGSQIRDRRQLSRSGTVLK